MYASRKGINSMIVPIRRVLTLQSAKGVMLEKETKGRMLHARRIDPMEM